MNRPTHATIVLVWAALAGAAQAQGTAAPSSGVLSLTASATIEVPKTSDLIVRLSGGNLVLSGITGNKDIDSVAGNAEIAIGDLNDYASMEATVKAGDLNVGAFTGAKTEDSFGLLHRASWSGKGTYKLRANLGAGNLVLRK